MHKRQAALEQINKVQRRLTTRLLTFSQVQIRSVQRLRNAWLALAQLCWLLLTELPTEISNSNIACQLCGAFTHLAWMLFWFTSGVSLENTLDFIFVRCWGHLSHICDEECSEQVSPPPSHYNRSHDPSPGRVLCPRLLFHHQWEDLHDDVRCRRKTNDECCVLWRKHEHGVLDSARLHS